MLIKIFLLPILLLFASCATTPSATIPTNFSSSTQGMLVGTIAIENKKPIFHQYFFHYLGENDKDITIKKMLTIRPEQMLKMKFKPDFAENNKAIYFFSITENAGKYHFSTLRLHENGGYIQNVMKVPMDINFTIEKGKVKYIGEIYFNYNKRLILLNDESQRDLVKFKEKYPALQIE